MTAQYIGSGEWSLHFDNKEIQLSESQMAEIVEQYEDMIYRDCQDDIYYETEDERKFRETITRGI